MSAKLEHARSWRAKNRERIREYNRDYQQRNRDRHTEWVREWRAKHPERLAAQQAVEKALRARDLQRPESCERCGEACVPHAHHEDYDKPLEVIWVCPGCHRKEHGHL